MFGEAETRALEVRRQRLNAPCCHCCEPQYGMCRTYGIETVDTWAEWEVAVARRKLT